MHVTKVHRWSPGCTCMAAGHGPPGSRPWPCAWLHADGAVRAGGGAGHAAGLQAAPKALGNAPRAGAMATRAWHSHLVDLDQRAREHLQRLDGLAVLANHAADLRGGWDGGNWAQDVHGGRRCHAPAPPAPPPPSRPGGLARTITFGQESSAVWRAAGLMACWGADAACCRPPACRGCCCIGCCIRCVCTRPPTPQRRGGGCGQRGVLVQLRAMLVHFAQAGQLLLKALPRKESFAS